MNQSCASGGMISWYVRWFVRIAKAAIEADLDSVLSSSRSIVTTDGGRIVPPMAHVKGELLLRSAQDDSLAFRLGFGACD